MASASMKKIFAVFQYGRLLVCIDAPEPVVASELLDWYAAEYHFERVGLTAFPVNVVDKTESTS